MRIDKKSFQKLSLNERYKVLRSDGEYIGAIMQGAHRRYLFAFSGYYVEVWIIISLNQVHWIEIQESQSVIHEYAKDIDVLGKLF
jgi:hypothetical protein